MPRLLLLLLSSIVLGTALGLGLTVAELGVVAASLPERGLPPKRGAAAEDPKAPQPRVEVAETKFDFGVVAQDSRGKHVFKIRNAGQAPLTLRQGPTSCKCTLSALQEGTLAPGATTEVTLDWHITSAPGPFRQTATIFTNDPARAEVVLTIEGKVQNLYRLEPDEIVFSNLSTREGSDATAKLFAYASNDIAVKKWEWTTAHPLPGLDFQVRPMTAAELAAEPGAQSGLNLVVQAKPGLPLGAFKQRIRLALNLPGDPTPELPVEGRVRGDISIAGPANWDSEHSLLELGAVPRNKGADVTLQLIVRGRDLAAFKPRIVKQSVALEASLGKPTPSGSITRVPLRIVVPRGAPLVNQLGTQQAQVGHVLIETGLATTPQLRVLVSFAVEE